MLQELFGRETVNGKFFYHISDPLPENDTNETVNCGGPFPPNLKLRGINNKQNADLVTYFVGYKSIPVMLGEVPSHSDLLISFEEMFYYQVAFARPYQISHEPSGPCNKLLSYIIKDDQFAIYQISIHSWFSPEIFCVDYIELFKNTETISREKFYCIMFSELKKRLLGGLKGISESDWKSLMFGYFPIISFGVNPLEISYHSSIVFCKFGELDSVLHSTSFSRHPCLLCPYNTSETPSTDLNCVLKASHASFSGGVCFSKQFTDLLKSNPASESPFMKLMHSLYLKVLTVNKDRLVNTVSKRYMFATCDDNVPFIRQWPFNENMQNQFYSDVYRIAMEALEHFVFHWDLRPPNVLYNYEV